MLRTLLCIGLVYFAVVSASGQLNVLAGTGLTIENGTTVHIFSSQQTLVVNSGANVLNNGLIVLGDSASISEASGYPIYGNGTERITKTIAGGMLNEDPGGLGCEMNTNASVGNITVIRGHTAFQNDLTDLSVTRWFEVLPAVNGGLDLSLRFHYDDNELNGNTESTLEVNRSSNSGVDWQILTSTVDMNNNYVDAFSIDSLTLFTLFAPGLATGFPDQVELDQELLVYPVPSSGTVWISAVAELAKAERLMVLDHQGRTVLEKEIGFFGEGPLMIAGNALSSGIYTVVLFTENGFASAKMIIEK